MHCLQKVSKSNGGHSSEYISNQCGPALLLKEVVLATTICVQSLQLFCSSIDSTRVLFHHSVNHIGKLIQVKNKPVKIANFNREQFLESGSLHSPLNAFASTRKRLYGSGKKQMSLKEKNCRENSSLYLLLGMGEEELKTKKKLYVQSKS